MPNAVIIPGFEPPTVPPVSWSSSALTRNTTAVNGQPDFQQIVRDTLRRSNGDGEGHADPFPKTPEPPPTVQNQTSTVSPNASAAATVGNSEGGGKPPTQKTEHDSAISPSLFMMGASVVLPVLMQNNQTAASPSSCGDAKISPLTSADSADADTQPPQAVASGNEAVQFAAQLQARLIAPPLACSDSPTGGAASAAGPPSSTPPLKISTSSVPAVQNGDAADVAAVIASSVAQVSNTLAAATVASPTQAPATASGLPTARTAMAGSASTQKAGAPDPTPVSSQNPQQGPRISSVLQQIEALQGSATVQSPTASVTFDLAQTAAQSQLSQAAERSALADVSASQTAATSDEPAANDARNAPSSPGNPTLVGAAQHSAAATNSYSTGQDSSSNQREQNLSDAQAPSDSSAARPQPEKSESSDFSGSLADISPAKLETAEAEQPTGTAPVIATPPQAAELAAHSASETLPSAPAQAQSSVPTLPISDIPLGHLVNSAQLTNAVGQSEMRIVMQTDKLGAIELRTRVSGDGVDATIFVEKRDAHAALAVELPALQQALSDKQLRVDQVSLTQGSLSSTTGDAGANAQQNPRGMTQPRQSTSFWNETRSLSTAAWFVPEQIGIFNDHGRLSVQA